MEAQAPRAILMGTGTSNGVPTLGRTYRPGYLDDPRNHRWRCSCLLKGPSGNVLIDCPPELRLQLLKHDVMDVEAVLITHTHADHVMGMDDLRAYCLKTQRAMPVYTRAEHQADIMRIFPYAFAEFPPGIWVPRFDLHDAPELLRAGGLEIRTFWVNHGPVPVMGIRVHDFAYITDVSEIPVEVWPLLKGLKTMVLDAVRFRPHRNHFHFEKAVEVAELIGAETTYFTHLSDDYDHAEIETILPRHLRLAYDGLTVAL